MSEKKNFNEDVFQSFSKNYVFESNKKQNKTFLNENIEFSFKKSLFLNDEDGRNQINNHNHTNNYNKLTLNDSNSNIYSMNDKNIQESGHFGKSKYESKNFRSIIEKNDLIINPLFHIETKTDEKENMRNLTNYENNENRPSFFNSQLKKIQIIRKKKSNKDNSITSKYNCLKNKKIGPISSLRNNKKIEEELNLIKKKFSNLDSNTMKNISNININNYSYAGDKEKNNKTFYKKSNTYDLIDSNIHQYYKNEKENENNHLFRKIIQKNKAINKKNNNNIPKSPTLLNNNYIKKLNESKENLPNNFKRNSQNYLHYENIFNVLKSNNSKYYNINDINSINLEPEKLYKKINIVNKSSNQNYINEIKIRKNKNNNSGSTNNHDTYFKSKRTKGEIKNKIINGNSDISYDKINLNKTSTKCLGVLKARAGKIQTEDKRGKFPTYRVTYDKRISLKEQYLPCYFENHGINY